MRGFAAILALLIGIAGWYYLFYSQAAKRLEVVEEKPVNQRRQRLRRVNGVAMVLLAALFYAGFFALDLDDRPRVFVMIWISVLALLLIIVILAAADLRLTARLRRKQ